MDLESKFEIGRINRTYQRIDSSYKVNIYVGYNRDGLMSLVITEHGKRVKVQSSKAIAIDLIHRKDGKMQLEFNLLDTSFKAMFLVFCRDIILVSEKAGPDMAVSNAILRWKYWREMFGRKRGNILEKNEIKGLIGELLELKDHFIPSSGEEKAVESWMGPLSGHKDFELDNTWYEIKSVNENAIQVTISSLEQLDSDKDGHLVIYRLEETSSVSEISINLNKVVLTITNLITDPDTLELFRSRLDVIGYTYDQEYDNFNYLCKGVSTYTVNRNFPRITRNDVGIAIGNVKYTIILSNIEEFKEQ